VSVPVSGFQQQLRSRREFKKTRGGFCKKSDTGPSSNSDVAETRVGSGASLYEIAPIKQGCVWRDNNLKAFVSICTLVTRFCTNGAITSFD
jgi:hypothetical protein